MMFLAARAFSKIFSFTFIFILEHLVLHTLVVSAVDHTRAEHRLIMTLSIIKLCLWMKGQTNASTTQHI